MKRRSFIRHGMAVAGGAYLGLKEFPYHLYAGAEPKRAQDVVTLGRTGIHVSRLAQGTGTRGFNKSSNQIRKLGDRGLADLLVAGIDSGLSFWDLADGYGSHPHARRALQTVKRERVTILTKTRATAYLWPYSSSRDRRGFQYLTGCHAFDLALASTASQIANSSWPS